MACIDKQSQCITREIFVELETDGHPPQLRRDGYDAFPCQVCGIRNGRGNVLGLERGILVKNALRRFTGSEIVENHGNRNARTPKTYRAVHDLRIGGYVGFPIQYRFSSNSIANIAPDLPSCE